MNVAIFAPYATVNSSFGTDLELAQEHLNASDDVTFITCESELRICDRNPNGSRLKCIECVQMQRKGLASLENTQKLTIAKLKEIPKKGDWSNFDGETPIFGSIQELKAFSIDSFDIGYAVAASIITQTGDSHPNLKQFQTLIDGLLRASEYAFAQLDSLFSKVDYEKVYVFNGRYSVTASCIAAAIKHSIAYATHDRGRTHEFYEVFDNANAADMAWFQAAINNRWLNSEDAADDRKLIVDRWYQRKRDGLPLEWISFTADQEKGRLPATWKKEEYNYVVFTTSENESATLGRGWENQLFQNQASGVKFLAESIEKNDRLNGRRSNIYVRIHPNQALAHRDEVQRFVDLAQENVEVVMPSSKVSTYAMLDACDVVITFGSTMGVEATYWGKPSLLLGPTFYSGVGATYNPQTHEQIIELLAKPLVPKPRDGAYQYAYLLATLGRPFKYYRPEDHLRGKFNGNSMTASFPLHFMFNFFRLCLRFYRFMKAKLIFTAT